MNKTERKKTDSKASIIFAIVVGILLIFAPIMMIISAVDTLKDMEHYQRVYQDAITVTATVSAHDSYIDESEDYVTDTDYRSYVSYVVDGKKYSHVEYEDKDTKDKLTPVGTQLELQVSPEDPSVLLISLKSGIVMLIIASFLLSGGLSTVYKTVISNKRSKEIHSTPDRETIQKDMKLSVQAQFGRPFWLLLLAFFIFLCLRYPAVVGNLGMLLVAVSGVCWLIFMCITIRDYKRIKNENYEIRRDVLIEKKCIPDSEGDTYKLIYRSGEKTWKKTTNKESYEKATEGDTVMSVYLPKKKQPLLHYDINGTVN